MVAPALAHSPDPSPVQADAWTQHKSFRRAIAAWYREEKAAKRARIAKSYLRPVGAPVGADREPEAASESAPNADEDRRAAPESGPLLTGRGAVEVRARREEGARLAQLVDKVEFEQVYAIEEAPRQVILISGETKTCDPVFGVGHCANGHRRPVVYACATRSCKSLVCRDHALAERTALLRPLIVDCFGPYPWGKLVLTYAPELWPKLRDARLLAKARQLGRAMLEGFLLERLPGKGWKLGIASVDHPCGDGAPDEGTPEHEGHVDGREWYPHHNFLFPLVAFRGRERAPLSPWLDVDELRRRWRSMQEVLLGRSLGGQANIWYNYAQSVPQKLALCSYFPRTFPDWPASGQRLTYSGAFGCRTIQTLPETRVLREAQAAGRLCDVLMALCGNHHAPNCGVPGCQLPLLVDFTFDRELRQGPIPVGYRALPLEGGP